MSEQENNNLNSSVIYKNVLTNMHDGVITIDLSGKIITFNSAAASIFMLEEKACLIGARFTEIFANFLLDPRNDELNDAILKAIYEAAVTHHKEVTYYHGEIQKKLFLSCTALIIEKNKIPEKIGVILVISDITERQRLNDIKDLFGKYIDPRIASRLMDQSEETLTKADRQVVTVSFCDLNNFTTLCETLPPTEMVELMNTFFSKMSEPVHQNGGVIDKFIGDAVMSFWGAPFTPEREHPQRGCQSALEQIAALPNLNYQLQPLLKNQFEPLSIHIGIATGELIIGNIGAKEFKSYTIMGNIVNLAARLVGANKVYGTHILLSEEVAKSVEGAFIYREIDTIRVKGKMNQTVIYELLGATGSISAAKIQLCEKYVTGLNYYRQRRWQEAKKQFNLALAIFPGDCATQVFLERINYFQTMPPPITWDGVWVLDSK